MLLSSLDFDRESGSAASMLAIMKTVQSLYFLGKTTHLIKKSLQSESIVPAAIVPAVKPVPTQTISYSW